MSYRIKNTNQEVFNNNLSKALESGYKLHKQGTAYNNQNTLEHWAILVR